MSMFKIKTVCVYFSTWHFYGSFFTSSYDVSTLSNKTIVIY